MGEVRRLLDDRLRHGCGVAADGGDVGVPVERRRQGTQVLGGQQVVGLLDVAGLGPLPVTLGEPGVDLEDPRRGGRRIGVAAQGEHPGEVADVLVADLGELVLAVVGLVGQAQPALDEVDQVAVGVAVVGADVGAEETGAAGALELAQEGREVAGVAQPGDGVEGRTGRRQPSRGDRLLVHERGIQPGDLALLLGQGRVPARGERSQLLDDRVDLLLRLVGQGHERSPAGAVRGDLLGVQPHAVDVAEQVVLRADRRVHAGAGVVENAHEGRGYASRPPAAGPRPQVVGVRSEPGGPTDAAAPPAPRPPPRRRG